MSGFGAFFSRCSDCPEFNVCDSASTCLRRTFERADQYRIYKDGDQWCAVPPGFKNLQESHAGFGPTPLQAMVALVETGLNDAVERLRRKGDL